MLKASKIASLGAKVKIALVGAGALSLAAVGTNHYINTQATKEFKKAVEKNLLMDEFLSDDLSYSNFECTGVLASKCTYDNVVVRSDADTVTIKHLTIYNPKNLKIFKEHHKGDVIDLKILADGVSIKSTEPLPYPKASRPDAISLSLNGSFGEGEKIQNSKFKISMKNDYYDFLLSLVIPEFDIDNVDKLEVSDFEAAFKTDKLFDLFYVLVYEKIGEEKGYAFTNKRFLKINKKEKLPLDDFKGVFKKLAKRTIASIKKDADNKTSEDFMDALFVFIEGDNHSIKARFDRKKASKENVYALDVYNEIQSASAYMTPLSVLRQYYDVSFSN